MSTPLPSGATSGATSYHDVCLDGQTPKAKVDKQQLIGGQAANSPDSVGSEVAPLQIDDSLTRTKSETSESLKIIIISAVVFGIAILVALIVSIVYAPPQVALELAVVVADDVACSTIGTDILKKGGSGVDAAIAALLCQGVVHLHTSGIGGGGCMLVRDHKKEHTVAIDFREEVPSTALPNLTSGTLDLGSLVAIPGQLRGLELAHQKFGNCMSNRALPMPGTADGDAISRCQALGRAGRVHHGADKLPWRDIVMPAVDLAKNGFNVSKELASALAGVPGLKLPGNMTTPREGEVLRLTEFAKTLKRVADEGADALYTGTIADEIVKLVVSRGGKLVKEDLAKYEARQTEPLSSTFHGVTVETAPPPAAGPILLMILNVLDTYPLSPANTSDTATYHRLIEAIKFGMGNLHKVGYPSSENITQQITSKAFASDIHKQIGTDTQSWKYYTDAPDFAPAEIQGTHVFVRTHLGDYISVISSLGGMPGERLITPGGITLNNAIVNFEKASSSNNVYAPGARPAFMLTPAIVHAEKRPCGIQNAIGGSLNSAAISDVAQVILNMVAYSMGLSAAIEAPRFQYTFNSSNVIYDQTLNAKVIDSLRTRGHDMQPAKAGAADHVDGVARLNETVYGHADSRGHGNVAFVN